MIVRLHPAAEQDISEAAAFYGNAGSARLAARFVAEFKRLVGILLEHPHIGVPRANGKRGLTMRRFPYTVIYRVEGECITILLVKHDSKHPSDGSQRS